MAAAGLPHRKDIDGLRFFAIVPVVLYHAFGAYIPSGFVGVDVFFAISGYLIGGIIYREASAGRFSFTGFYARRARRILPALFCVIIFTLIGCGFILNSQEMEMLTGSAQWTIVGVSNVFFFRHIDYFARESSVNPLLMTWSLGIEEQFYLFFPFVVLALLRFKSAFHILGLSALNTVSLLIAIYLAAAYPLAGFYLLPSRAWEMGAGAALAIFHLQVPGERRWGASSSGLAATGLIMILASCWMFDEQTPFPGYAALLPVLGTLLLLHTADSRVNRAILTARVFVGIGLISYSWYLWHWPLMAIIRVSASGATTFAAMAAATLASLCLAYLSWRFVEQPFRRGTLPQANILMRYGAIGATMLLALAWFKHEDTFASYRLPPQAQRIERVQQMTFAEPGCMTALGATELPKERGCAPPGASVALFGDSHATHLRYGLRHYVEAQGSHLLQITKAGCPPFLGYSHKDDLAPGSIAECAEFQALAVDRLANDPAIRTVVLSAYLDNANARASYRIEKDGFSPVSAQTAAVGGTTAMLSVFEKAGKHVILVLDAPKYDRDIYSYSLSSQIPWRRYIGELTSSAVPPRSDVIATASMRAALKTAFERHRGVTILDLKDTFCTSNTCEYLKDGLPLYHDDHHLSILGAQQVDWKGVLPVTSIRGRP